MANQGSFYGTNNAPIIEPEKKSNKKIIFIVSIIIIILVGGASAYYFRDKLAGLPVIKDLISRDQALVIESETANWQTYQNGKYSFETKYPQNYNIKIDDDKDGLFVAYFRDSQGNAYYGIHITEKIETPKLSNFLSNPECYEKIKTSEQNDILWTINDWKCGIGAEKNPIAASTISQNNVFEIFLDSSSYTESLTRIDYILSTFKFQQEQQQNSQLDLCKKEKESVFKEQQSKNYKFPFSPVFIYGKIKLPSEVFDFSNLKINYGAFDVSNIHTDGTFCLIANKDQSVGTLINVTRGQDQNVEIILEEVITAPQEGQSLVVDSKTTAAALIYLTPGVPGSSKEAKIILEYIYSIPKLSDLENLISSELSVPGKSLKDVTSSTNYVSLHEEIVRLLVEKTKNCGGLVEGCTK